MDYYTNEDSLKATYGDGEAAGLMMDSPGISSAVRLEKAAAQAYAEINTYLHSANYITPLVFTPFGAAVVPPAVATPLNALIQGISDCFTAFHLAAATDLNKAKYESCRAEGLAWLKAVLEGSVVLDFPTIDPLGVPGGIVTVARPAVFNRHLRRERDIFGGVD